MQSAMHPIRFVNGTFPQRSNNCAWADGHWVLVYTPSNIHVRLLNPWSPYVYSEVKMLKNALAAGAPMDPVAGLKGKGRIKWRGGEGGG